MVPKFFAVLIAASSHPFTLVGAAADLVQSSTLSAPSPLSTPASNSSRTNSSSTLTASCNLAGSSGVSGQVHFTLESGSEDVDVKIAITGLMAINSSAQYAYHIHTNPISADGNCSSALGHLDPLQITDALTCDPLVPQYCQEGDLAGRHGKLPGNETSAELSYTDKFIRFWPQPFSILGRSIVVHAPNSTRLACGNITSFVDGTADTNGNPTGMPSNYVTDYPTKALPAGAKVAPFVGTMTDTAVLAAITLPASLPDVDSVPDVVLISSAVVRTINSTVATITLPAAAPAATPFNYTPGAPLPSQAPVALGVNSTANPSSNKPNASSAYSLILNPITLIAPLILGYFI